MLLDNRGCQDLGDLRPALRVDLQQLAHEVDQVCAVLAWCDRLVAASHDLGPQLCHRPGLKGHPATAVSWSQQPLDHQGAPTTPSRGRGSSDCPETHSIASSLEPRHRWPCWRCWLQMLYAIFALQLSEMIWQHRHVDCMHGLSLAACLLYVFPG